MSLRNKTYTTQANKEGKWAIKLPSQEAGGPFEMVFHASNTIRVQDKYADVVRSSENPNIRQFLVPDKYDFKTEHDDFEAGNWESANPESLLTFSGND